MVDSSRPATDAAGVVGPSGEVVVSKFVPDFRRMVRPIVDLLSAKSDGRWGPEHIAALNLIAEQVYN